MKKLRKTILLSGILLSLILASGFFMHQSVASWRWNKAASAAGMMPYQIGLTNAVVVNCLVSGYVCSGGTLCSSVPVASCPLYAEANGASAGGSGQPPLLLSQTAIGMSGLSSGGQLIYGGTANSMFISPNSVLASTSGCFGCMAKQQGAVDKIFAWLEKLDKYIIAGFKSN